jgi:hypothetical protein
MSLLFDKVQSPSMWRAVHGDGVFKRFGVARIP